ncbi:MULTISPECIES: ferritin-like domain-containing protein [unclassified Coleofasciculus]|uniref:ferritin-like domain-containing protein n=2 Tax=Cyanobacteriota TaxID=1117 RepID=UPI001682BEB1|nr:MULTISPECIES: ferritin-like domain-containing protein [unclassified Coleofasciculus]MBD1877282.1 ferritin-like domain-containing protein [Coleofasciculus sp. FACHB-T130]MBD1899917.1 ferritin-like domain-containing protein [Coleofasciculus sp. FACHB-125]
MERENTFAKRFLRPSKTFSRRGIMVAGTVTGVASALGLTAIADGASAASREDKRNDAAILNKALFFEHQAIWAYGFAATKLSDTDVGKAVLALALRNQADHKTHRDTLASVVKSLGATPVTAKSSYDLSSYIKAGEGNIDSDVNIAKLALALETDAAIAYTREIAKLKTPALITAGASIGSDESAHATAIRAAFKSLGVDIEIVPASFVSADTRKDWVLKV